jgi:hypothetical protein
MPNRIFAENSAEKIESIETLFALCGVKKYQDVTNVEIITKLEAGINRRARRDQKLIKENFPVLSNSLKIMLIIRYPEMTKNISTPINPDWMKVSPV